MEIGERIKALMVERGFTQKSLAEACGFGETGIRDIIRPNPRTGKWTEPLGSRLYRIAKELDVPMERILGERELSSAPRAVKIRGYAAAGPEGYFLDSYTDGDGIKETVEPFDPDASVAVIVKGMSMAPRFREGEKLVFGPISEDPAPHLYKEVLAHTDDDRFLIKIVRPGQNGLWDLASHNEAYPVIPSVSLRWVRPFEGLRV
jgi:transcriptional regulator with XRE-family HTH domain